MRTVITDEGGVEGLADVGDALEALLPETHPRRIMCFGCGMGGRTTCRTPGGLQESPGHDRKPSARNVPGESVEGGTKHSKEERNIRFWEDRSGCILMMSPAVKGSGF